MSGRLFFFGSVQSDIPAPEVLTFYESGATTGTTITLSVGSVQPNSRMILTVAANDDAQPAFTVTGTFSTTWTRVDGVENNNAYVEQWYSSVLTGSESGTIQIDKDSISSPEDFGAIAMEVANLSTSTAVVASTQNSGFNDSPGFNTITAGSVGNFFVGSYTNDDQVDDIQGPWSNGFGELTKLETNPGSSSGTANNIHVVAKITQGGNENTNNTLNNFTQWAALLVEYQGKGYPDGGTGLENVAPPTGASGISVVQHEILTDVIPVGLDLTVNMPQTYGSGNKLLIAIMKDNENGGGSFVQDVNVGGFSIGTQLLTHGGGEDMALEVWYYDGTLGVGSTLTVDFASGADGDGAMISVIELNGAANGSPKDSQGFDTQSGSSITSASVDGSPDPGFVIAWFGHDRGDRVNSSFANGYTLLHEDNTGGAAGFDEISGSVATLDQTASGSTNTGITWNGGGGNDQIGAIVLLTQT